MTPRLRKILIIAGIITVTLLVAAFFFNTASTVELTAKTNQQRAEITVSASGKQIAKGRGNTTFRLAPGQYTLTATFENQETRTITTVGRGQANNVDLTLKPPKEPFAIAPFAAANLRAGIDMVRFIWSDYNQLTQIAQDGTNGAQITLGDFQQATWVNDTQAYLLDTGGIYYFFDGQVKSLPYGVDQSTLATAPTGAVAYVNNQTVFIRPDAFAAPSAEFKTEASQPQLALSAQGFVLVYDITIGPESTGEQQPPAIFKDSQKMQAASEAIKDKIIMSAAWSPDGTKVALSAGDGLFVLDVTNNNLTTLYQQTPDNPESIVWAADDSLLYLLEDKIWQVTMGPSTTWTKLAQSPQSLGIASPLALAPNKKVFFSTNTAKLQGAIFTFNLE